MANSANGDIGFIHMQKKDCFFFVHYGKCSYGQNCKYNHPPQDSAVVQEKMNEDMLKEYTRKIPCKFFHAGFCIYGTNCDFNHSIPDPPPVQYNSDGLPMRMGEQLCSFYLHNRWCGYGAGCKFHHPELYFVPQEYGSYAFNEDHEEEEEEEEEDDEMLGSAD